MTKDQNFQIHNTTIITYCVGAQHVVRSLSSGCMWRCGCVEQVAPRLHISRRPAALYIVFTALAFGTRCLVATNATSSWLYLCVRWTSYRQRRLCPVQFHCPLLYIYICVCVCVRARACAHIYTYTHAHPLLIACSGVKLKSNGENISLFQAGRGRKLIEYTFTDPDIIVGYHYGKLPLRTCRGCSVPEPYRSPDWAVVPAQTGPRVEY